VRQAPGLPQRSPAYLPGGLRLHFHGVNAEEVAEILRAQDRSWETIKDINETFNTRLNRR